jgi:hypothetical protein
MSLAKCKPIMAIVLILSLLSVSVGFAANADPFTARPAVMDEEPTGAEMLLDVALVRPISLLGMIVGAVGWVIAAPLAAIADGSEGFSKVSQKLVVTPAKYTFYRSVGEF